MLVHCSFYDLQMTDITFKQPVKFLCCIHLIFKEKMKMGIMMRKRMMMKMKKIMKSAVEGIGTLIIRLVFISSKY